ncbi:MAG: ATP-binding protein [Treponema sp.]|nr:ATP-binding protein [Treponema sp.]
MVNYNDVIRSFFKKNRAFSSINLQMLIIVIAFIIMGTVSVVLFSRKERMHLLKDADNILTMAETRLNSDFFECEVFLDYYSQTIHYLLLSGVDEETIFFFMRDRDNLTANNINYIPWIISAHGFFYLWDGVYIASNDRNQALDSARHDEPIYQAAVDARGEIIISRPSRDIFTGQYFITFSKSVSGEDGEPLAVISIDIDLSMFSRYSNVNITRSSYGILLNEKMDIIAHENTHFHGLKLFNINSALSNFSHRLESGYPVYNQRAGTSGSSKAFFRNMKYGWHYGITIPESEYFSELIFMAVLLIVSGVLLASGLCAMIYYISLAKIKSDIRTQQKSNFLATMSHEVRTPLNAIIGITEIQMHNAAHPPATHEVFMKISNSGKLLLNIINDILDLSKIESGKLELNPVKYDVASLINDIVQLNYIRYEDKPINFSIDIDENIPAILVGDELRIKQILNNLLSNAFKYTDSGEVRFFINAHVVGRGGGAVVVTLIFRVEDTGQGMTQEQLNKLYDEYTRFNLEANRATEGAGLGMTITRNLINLMYGQIDVKSAFGEGTAVTVRLPQKTEGMGVRGVIGKQTAENLKLFKHNSSLQMKKTKISHEYMPYGRILIVDDVETNLYVAQGLMAPYGLKIDLASSGFEAINKIKEGIIYDIVFMDHMMPKMDGLEATRLIRSLGYARPVVALTANAISGQVDMFLSNGFDDFISKPIDVRLLNIILNRLIRDKQPKEVLEAAKKEKEKLENSGGSGMLVNKKISSRLAEIFTRDAEKAIEAIKTAYLNNFYTDEDIQLYIINVHSMKSALANIGENALSSAALKLEQAGRDKRADVMLSETQDFLYNLEGVISRISSENKEEEKEDNADDLALLSEKLLIIKEACASMDKKTAKTAMNELNDKKWSLKTNVFISVISGHLLHSEFEEVVSAIDKFFA